MVAKRLCVSDTRVLDNLNANKHLDILQLWQYKNNSKYINYKYTNNNLKCRKKLISIKPISNIEHLNKVIHRKEIYEERSIEQVNRKLFWYYCTKCLFIVIWIATTIKLNLFQYVVIGIMALIATLRVDTAKTMMFVIKWQAAVLEDVRRNGWEIDVMVGLMMKMKIYTPYQKPL